MPTLKKIDIENTMIQLQVQMDELQLKEANAHKKKIDAEREISNCNISWYQIYQQYQKCKEKLNALNK